MINSTESAIEDKKTSLKRIKFYLLTSVKVKLGNNNKIMNGNKKLQDIY